MSNFLDELKRRRVIRAAVVYLGAAFVVLQAADLLIEALGLPSVVFKTIAIACIVGLPVALVLSWAFDIGGEEQVATTGDPLTGIKWMSGRSLIAVIVLVGFGILLGLAPQFLFGPMADTGPVSVGRYEILLPEDAPIEFIGSSPLAVPTLAMAITPDGNTLVYVGSDKDAKTQLYARNLGEFDVLPLPGSEGAYAPFISQDGEWVAFFANDQLRVVPISGGEARVVAETPNPQGGAWWGTDRIIYADREGTSYWSIEIEGGTPQALPVNIAEEFKDERGILGSEYHPLPDGERFLVGAIPGRVVAYSPATGDLQDVMDIPVNVRVARDTLAYAIGNQIMALDFDTKSAKTSGDRRVVATELRRDGGRSQFVVSDRTLIYATGAPYGQVRFQWVDRNGNVEPLDLPPDRYRSMSFSPDATRIAVAIRQNFTDLWIVDLATLEKRRLTRGGFNSYPHWSHDGSAVFFSSGRNTDNSTLEIFRTTPNAAPGDAVMVMTSDQSLTIDKLHANDIATLARRNDLNVPNVHAADLRTGTLTQLTSRAEIVEDLSHISPDGRWLAMTTDQTGRYDVFLQSLEDSNLRVPISTDGGEESLWAPDMSEIYYRYGAVLYRVPLAWNDDMPVPSPPEFIFEDDQWVNVPGFSYWRNPADGRFLVLRADQPATARSLRVIEGWRGIGTEEESDE